MRDNYDYVETTPRLLANFRSRSPAGTVATTLQGLWFSRKPPALPLAPIPLAFHLEQKTPCIEDLLH